MATHALKRFRLKHVIKSTAPLLPSSPAFASHPLPSQGTSSSVNKANEPSFQAPHTPLQHHFPFQFPSAGGELSTVTNAQTQPQPEPSTAPRHVPRRINPFVPQLNAKTGRWAPPKCSLRQQADLIKKARAAGVLDLLPPSPKTNRARETIAVAKAAQPTARLRASGPSSKPRSTHTKDAWWQKPVEWIGKVKERKVAGAEIGNRMYGGRKMMFKGHKWERLAEERTIQRKMLLRDMPKRIARYKQYYKRRRPNPLKSAGAAKNAKLPF